jgi:hypothetical protein
MSEVEQSPQQETQSNPPKTDSVTFPTKVEEDPQVASERKAFKTYVESTGEPVPDNFKDADAWFSSLKEAQSNYTQGQQEIAELKKQYAEQPLTDAPEEAVEKPVASATTTDPEITPDTPELRIPEQKIAEETEQAAQSVGVDAASYEAWGVELAQNGSLSEATKNDIKSRTGFTDDMINDYVAGQKARLKENFSLAASVVGGREKLQEIFNWAGENLDQNTQQQINMGLASPSYEVTLRGLSSMYDEAMVSARAAEPAKNENLAAVPSSETGIRPYASKTEFTAERNNPKFNQDPRYRKMVEARMSMTNWNNLPQY